MAISFLDSYNDASVILIKELQRELEEIYEKRNEQYGEMLSDLVIGTPFYGFLLIQHIAGDAVLTGTLNAKYFYAGMVDDIVTFLENNIPSCRNIYFG